MEEKASVCATWGVFEEDFKADAVGPTGGNEAAEVEV